MERLDRSHRRLEERLIELEVSASNISLGELSLDDKSLRASWEAVADVLAYLERAGLRHEEDEEETVFPRLAAVLSLRPLLKALRAEHRTQRKLIDALAKLVRGQSAPATAAKLRAVVANLQTSYEAHIQREEAELLPAISRYVDAAGQAEMAAEMVARRSEH